MRYSFEKLERFSFIDISTAHYSRKCHEEIFRLFYLNDSSRISLKRLENLCRDFNNEDQELDIYQYLECSKTNSGGRYILDDFHSFFHSFV
jgi:hypothetical protein